MDLRAGTYPLNEVLMLKSFARRSALLLSTLAALAGPWQSASACTSFVLHSADGGAVYGRTMEFGLPLQSEFVVIPRHLALAATGPDGADGAGLKWTTKYGVVGMDALQASNHIVDGLNEAGLAGGLLYLPGYAKYQDVPADKARDSIAAFDLLTYVLSNFATVAEVRDGLQKIYVSNAPHPVFGGAPPTHLTLHDASGANLVVEYIGGQLQIHDNPIGVLTNAPNFDWHIANLGLYLNTSVVDPKPLKIGDLTISPPSTGSGAPGLPGNMSAPSRFVRAFLYSYAAPKLPTSAEAVDEAFHILNNFDISPGVIRTSADSQAGGGVAGLETTEWSTVADLKTKTYYIRTYENPQTRAFHLDKANLDAKSIVSVSVAQPAQIIDLTK
jgi:choloylglycine hydrolase